MLLLEDIVPGCVAYLDPGVLNASSDVLKPAHTTPRPGPFVCLQTSGAQSCWTPLTNQQKYDAHTGRALRVEIANGDWTGGIGEWASTSSKYLNDGATTYAGASTWFLRAAEVQDTLSAESRPTIASAKVADIVREVRRRRGHLLV